MQKLSNNHSFLVKQLLADAPKLAPLIEQLTNPNSLLLLSEDYTSEKQDVDLMLEKNKEAFFKLKFVLDALIDSVLDELDTTHRPSDVIHKLGRRIAHHQLKVELTTTSQKRAPLSDIKTTQTLNADEMKNYHPQNVTEQDFDAFAKSSNLSPLTPPERSYIKRHVETRLISHCKKLLTQLGYGDSEDIENLPDLVRTEKLSCESLASDLRLAESVYGNEKSVMETLMDSANFGSFNGVSTTCPNASSDIARLESENWKCLSRNIDLLCKLGLELKLDQKCPMDDENIQYSIVKCKTLSLKMKCLHLEILTSTYTKSSVEALMTCQAYLHSKTEKVRDTIRQLTSRLEQYESVGDEMKSLVAKYVKVKSDIEDKRWALNELQKK